MDPNELIKHVPELLKDGGALAGALKFTDIVKAMLGPATAEVAERFRDHVRLYRYGRQLECLNKAEKMATDAGFTPKAVPIKILFPLLEGASLEEDEDLHTMWAALLANASSTLSEQIRPRFIGTLREMSSEGARFINAFHDHVMHDGGTLGRALTEQEMGSIYSTNVLGRPGTECVDELFSCLSDLRASHLIDLRYDLYNPDELVEYYSLTPHGYNFVNACRPPKPEASKP